MPPPDAPPVVAPMEWAVSGAVGTINPQGALARDPHVTLGGRARWRPSPGWALEVAAGWDGLGADPRLIGLHLFGDANAALVPVLSLGVGAHLGGDGPALLVEGGTGLDIVLLPWLDLRATGDLRVTTTGEVAFAFSLGPQAHTLHRYDEDGDGVPDSRDGCRTHPEDRDGFMDVDGCPDPDDDGDGVNDDRDACIDMPEDVDGFLDRDGCPDPDNDGDGRADSADRCPLEPEDVDGTADLDGCPDFDNDNDHLYDDIDQCPNVAEDEDGWADTDGCPDPDNDGDGVGDRFDLAPDAAETINGFEDGDGLPDALPPILARLIGPVGGLTFEADALTEASPAPLGLLASALQTWPKVRAAIRVSATTLELATARGERVRDALVADGVDRARLDVEAAEGADAVDVRLVP